ncbi:Helicase sen1 [Zancudomyces culisetae]|uniref:Helicase sen1 n=1 Tax=Zancudomyces culisetae TaxID=1213189 RepID=A0A1R1PSI0_ZANCU|nr:Helicase sen1 [Zancudomyces culisetae]|eukprot:OMH83853.1 Helicase sen1 [Zancudomyces culisetae]
MPRQHLRTKDAAVNMQAVRKHMNQYLVNEPQAVAIETVMQNDGFTLVQGPPGTGKTRTILALISLLLASGPKVDSDSGGSTRLLVCAPSNAAVDEIAQRLKMGIVNAQGKVEVPRIVRVGQLESMNSAVRDISLDRLLEEELGNFTLDRKASALNKAADNKGDPRRWSSNKIDPQLSLVYTQYLELTQKQTSIEQRLAQANNEIARLRKEESTTGQLQSSQIAMAIADRKQLSGELSHTRANILASKKSFEALKRRLRNAVLGRAQVVLATLSGSGHESLGVFVTAHRFQCVIVDEASQAVEMSALIPLRYGPTKCVFVGDPNQLPPTVLSLDAGSYGYNQSLFVRMMLNNCDVQLLSIQYRMHPSISYLPSSLFYDRRLLDAENLSVSRSASWHRLAPFFAPLVFFDVDGFEKVGTTINNSSSHSLYNLREAQFAVLLVRCLALLFPGESLFGRIGVITPYKQQLRLLRNQFRNAFGNDVTDGPIDFNTIDGFQGQEKDIILFSCVRAGSSLGFLNDRRRINVAITRAKQSLFIIGNYNALVNASTSTSTSIPSSISDITTKNGGNAINETINGKTNGSGNGNQSHNKQTPYWSTLLTYVRDNSLLIPNARKALLEFARPQKIDLFAKNEPALKNLLNS